MALDKFYEGIINDPDYKNASLRDKELVFQNLIATRPDFREASNEQQMAILQSLGLMEGEAPKPERTQAEQMRTEQTQAEQIAQDQTQGGAPSEIPAISDTAALVGGAGAAKGVAETFLPKPTGTSAAEASRAAERFAIAQDRLREAQRAMASGPAGQMGSVEDLRNAFNNARAEVEAARQNLVQLQQEGRAMQATPATSAAQSVAPSRTVPGASGAQNWARAMATQELPESLVEQVDTMRKTGPGGAQRLIDEDIAKLQKIRELGAGDYRLTGEGRGQLMLPPEEAGKLEQELSQKQSQQAAERARIAQAAEEQRLAQQMALQEQQAAVRGQAQQSGQRAQVLGAQTKEAERLARKVAEEEAKTRIAQEAAERAKASKVGALSQIGSNVASRKLLGPLLGGLAGVGTAMSVDEAIKRYRAGDYSGAVMPTLEAAFGAMSMVPPVGPLAAVKGLGTAGGLGLMGIEGGKAAYDYLKRKLREREEEEKKNAGRGQ